MNQLRGVSRSSTSLFMFMYFTSTWTSSQVSKMFIFTTASLRARSSHRQVPISQCSIYHLLLLACTRCLLCRACFASAHGPFIVGIAQLFHQIKVDFLIRLFSGSGVWDPRSIEHQSCNCWNVVVVLMQRLASFPGLHDFSLYIRD